MRHGAHWDWSWKVLLLIHFFGCESAMVYDVFLWGLAWVCCPHLFECVEIYRRRGWGEFPSGYTSVHMILHLVFVKYHGSAKNVSHSRS